MGFLLVYTGVVLGRDLGQYGEAEWLQQLITISVKDFEIDFKKCEFIYELWEFPKAF